LEDDTFKRILQDKQFHQQIKAEQKKIIQMCWKESRDHVCRFENGSQMVE
jgi:hypothetical protein